MKQCSYREGSVLLAFIGWGVETPSVIPREAIYGIGSIAIPLPGIVMAKKVPHQ
jgi:hypothetical protein